MLFAFYFVSLPSAYLYGIYLDMKLDGLVLGITSGSFVFALINFIILKFGVNWRKVIREIHNKMSLEKMV